MDEKKKVNFGMKEFKEKLQRATASISPREVKKMIEELSEALAPYLTILENEDLIKAELEKRGFNEDIYELADSDDPEKQQLFLDAFHAVDESHKLIERQKESRARTRQASNAAKNTNIAVTGLWKKDRLFSPTSDELAQAFSPGHIYYYANVNNSKKVSKVRIDDEEELQELKNTSRFLFDLLTSLRAESEPDIYNQVIKDPSKDIVFSVTKVAKSIGFDPRSRGNENNSKRSNQSLMIQRGEAMMDMLSQLSNYVGKFDDGSFYYVCIVKYYDSNTDTIKMSVPYIGEVLRRLQNKYIGRQEIIKEKRLANKRISKQDNKPFEKNDLLKGTCRGLDSSIYEIMLYITTLMVRNGAGEKKEVRPKYSKIIENCPSLQSRLNEIEAQNIPAKTKARDRNNEFRKFSLAWKCLIDPKYSAMSEEWSNIFCSPTDKKGMLKAPTNTTINDKILIQWSTKKPM
jgi:hypothetical protein